ncbi:MAG TPA: thiamine phosphate synthase, partial [Parvibaculum sp.]
SLRGGCGLAVTRRTGLVMTAAAHSEAAIFRAARARIDAVLISPVFPTASHPGAPALGVVRFARLAHLARRLGLRVYALGGITGPASLRRLTGSGADGVAGVGFLSQA